MSREELEVSYDQFYLKPFDKRREIFNEISAENRAFLVKTQAERWLAANRSRLTAKQISVVEEMNRAISPEWYKMKTDFSEKVDPKVEALIKKVEAVLSHEDLLQLATNRADYIPLVEND